MVEVNCETDFVARTEDFEKFVAALLRQVAAQPIYNADDLLAAPYIDNPGKTVKAQLTDLIAKLGENMRVRQAARFELQGEGLLDSYIHFANFGADPRVGVLVEIGGKPGEKLTELAHDLALHIAASAPRYVAPSDIPADVLQAEKNSYLAELVNENKPDNIKERIIEGKLKKWYGEVLLLEQLFIKDPEITIGALIDRYSKETGAPLTVRRFARFERGA
jgi:elongation factor Ts